MYHKFNLINNFAYLLILLFPISYLLGIAVADINFVLLVLLFFFTIIIRKDYKVLFQNNIYIFFFIFWLYIVFISFFATNTFDSFSRSITFIRYVIFFISIVYFRNHFSKHLNRFLYFSIFIIITLFALDLFLQYISGFNIFGIEKPGNHLRVNGILGICLGCVGGVENNRFVAGSFIISFAPLCLLYLKNKLDKLNLFLNTKVLSYLIFFVLLLISILITGDRIAYVKFPLFILLSLTFPYLILKNNFYKLFLYSAIISILSFLIFLPFLTVINLNDLCFNREEIGFCRTFIRFTDLTYTLSNFFSSSYAKIFISAILVWIDNPIIGTGLKNFRYDCLQIIAPECTTHPHNFYLEVLAETGIIGFTIFMTIIYFFIRQFIVSMKSEDNPSNKFNKWMLFASLIIVFWPISTTGSFFSNSQGPFIFYFIGMASYEFIIYKKI